MNNFKYRCTYEEDDNGTFLVSCDAFPEVVTFGKGFEWAWVNARGAIEEAIAARIADGREIPSSTLRRKVSGQNEFWIRLDQLTAQKVMLYNLLRRLGVTRAELARQLEWHREQVDRLFRLDHMSKPGQLDAAFKALGYQVVTDLEKIEQPGHA